MNNVERSWNKIGTNFRDEIRSLARRCSVGPPRSVRPSGRTTRFIYPYGGQPFVRGFSGIWAKSTGKTGKIPAIFLIFHCFYKVFQAQILRKYPRRSCGSFWSGLELRNPKFDRFRHLFPFFFRFFDPHNMKIQLVPFIFKRTGPETMPRT